MLPQGRASGEVFCAACGELVLEAHARSQRRGSIPYFITTDLLTSSDLDMLAIRCDQLEQIVSTVKPAK
jgi:phage terminase small subunit